MKAKAKAPGPVLLPLLVAKSSAFRGLAGRLFPYHDNMESTRYLLRARMRVFGSWRYRF